MLVLQHEQAGYTCDISERLRVLALPEQAEMFPVDADDAEETLDAAAKRLKIPLWRLRAASRRSGTPDALPCIRRGRAVTVRRRAVAEWQGKTIQPAVKRGRKS